MTGTTGHGGEVIFLAAEPVCERSIVRQRAAGRALFAIENPDISACIVNIGNDRESVDLMAGKGGGAGNFAAVLQAIGVTEDDFCGALNSRYYKVEVLHVGSESVVAVLLNLLYRSGCVVILELDKLERTGFALRPSLYGDADNRPVHNVDEGDDVTCN